MKFGDVTPRSLFPIAQQSIDCSARRGGLPTRQDRYQRMVKCRHMPVVGAAR
jgi:hypothetical protein